MTPRERPRIDRGLKRCARQLYIADDSESVVRESVRLGWSFLGNTFSSLQWRALDVERLCRDPRDFRGGCSADSHERGEKLGSSIGQICSASVASQPSTRLTALQQFLRSILLHAAQVERGWAVCCATNATNHTVGPMRQVASGWVFFVKCEQRPQKMTFRRRFLRNKIHSSLLMKTRAFRRFSGRGKQGLDRIL